MIRLQIPASSAMLDAHFPGHPIVPGAALLDLIITALAISMPCNAQVKFLQPVRPGDELLISSNGAKFEARVGETLVCSGSIK